MHNHSNSLKKPSYYLCHRRKYIIKAIIIILCILAGYIYMVVTWTPLDSESKKASEKFIREAAAKQLNKDPNDLTDDDFQKIIDFSFGTFESIQELSDIKLLEKFTNLQYLDIMSFTFPKKEIPSCMKILAKLGMLDLTERFAIDLSPLEKMGDLKVLSLSESSIVNIKDFQVC